MRFSRLLIQVQICVMTPCSVDVGTPSQPSRTRF